MAVTTERVDTGSRAVGRSALPTWVWTERGETIPLPLERLAALIRDVPAWVLWDPSVVRVEHDSGPLAEAGMVCQLVIGTRAAGVSLSQMTMAVSERAIVFAGGQNGRWRFIDVFELSPQRETTEVHRRLEIELQGWMRLFRPLVAVVARRYLRRALDALT
ncbi:MAG TPA: SRPBCC family protein [Acidimicrobiia bacterium]|nr:SRPBCC family protein [Acidimicrobiia bacterium]